MMKNLNLTSQRLLLWGMAAFLPVLASCGSTTNRGATIDDLSRVAVPSEYTAMSDETMNAFNTTLREYAEVVGTDMTEQARGVKARLSQLAIQYRVALDNGLFDDDSIRVRGTAASALGFTNDPLVAAPLAAILGDPAEPEFVRSRASLGLAALGVTIRDSAKRAEVMDVLRRTMLSPASTVSMKLNSVTAYAQAYSKANGDSLSPLMNALNNDPNESVRRQVLVEARDMREPDVLPTVVQVGLSDPSPSIRSVAALVLGEIADPLASEALYQAVRDDSSVVRKNAVFAISGQRGVIDDADLVSVIEEAMWDPDEQVRLAGVRSARRLSSAQLVTPLVGVARSDSSSRVQLEALNAIGEITPSEMEVEILPLVESLNHGDPEVVTAAQRSLAKVTGQTNIGRSDEAWKRYYFAKYPARNPENIEGPRPRVASSNGTLATPNRTNNRTPNRTTNNRTNNRTNRTNTRRTTGSNASRNINRR